MRGTVGGVFCLSLVCFGECDPEAALQELAGVRAQVEEGDERAAKKSLARTVRSAGACAEDVRVGNTIADLALRLGQEQDALRYARIVEESSRRKHGPQSIQLAVSLETLAQALAKNGKELESEPAIREAIGIIDGHGGQTSLFKARLLNLLATLHVRLDDPEGAQRQLERAWTIVKGRPEEVLRLVVMLNMSAVAEQQGRVEEARSRMAEVERDLRRLPAPARREIEGMSIVKALR